MVPSNSCVNKSIALPVIPNKLKFGDEVRLIAPSRSFSIIPKDQRELSLSRFKEMGLKVSFGKHVDECDRFNSSKVESRINDLHEAFSDPNIKAVITAIGGFNSNQLLKSIDFDLIRKNPKIFCGYSDITALQNAFLAKCHLVTYSGPHFSTFAMKKRFEFTMEHFKKCLFESTERQMEFELKPSEMWSDDAWYADQENRTFIENPGFQCIQEGAAEGIVIGANLCTFNLLHGTEFLPSFDLDQGTILFVEEDESLGSFTDVEFARNLQSVFHQPKSSSIRGLVIGRFQKKSMMTFEKIQSIVRNIEELRQLPVVANVDFGHTDPYITFPIGGSVRMNLKHNQSRIWLTRY